MKVPELSVVIPTYNNLPLLKEMIISIISQDFIDWELILVDDGSTKEVIDLIKDYESKDSRITFKLRDRQPKGAQTCRNIGLNLAKGKYIIFFDSDDLIEPFCFTQRVNFMNKNQNLDFAIFPAASFIDSKNNIQRLYGNKKSKNDLRDFIIGNLPFVVWNNIYKRDFLLKSNISWDENVECLQDTCFNFEVLLHNPNYEYAFNNSKIDYYYRWHNNENISIAKKIRRPESFKSHLYLFEKMISLIHSKYGKKYDKFLRIKADFFFLIFINNEKDKSYEYLNKLYKTVRSLNNSNWLVLRFKLYFRLNCQKYKIFKYIFFPYKIRMKIISWFCQ